MWHLYRQEVLRLRPFVIISVLIFGGNLLITPFSEALDTVSWQGQMEQFNASAGHFYGFIVLLMAMLFAYGAFPREHEEKTIEFLYALPVARRSIFAAKFFGSWTVIGLGLVSEQIVAWLLQAANPQSLTGEQFRLHLALQVLALTLALGGIGVCHGLLLSFGRRFGWLLYGFVMLGVIIVGERMPGAQILDPSRLMVLQYDGQELIWPWQGLLVQGAIAVAVLAAAYFLWMSTGEDMERLYGHLRSRIWGRITLGCSTAVLVVMGFAAMLWIGSSSDDEDTTEGAVYRSFQTTHLETEHFRMAFPESLGGMARDLVSEADQVYAALVDDLADPEAGPIVAKLDLVQSNHLGVELGGVLRASLSGDRAQDLRVFAHETAHVFQWHLAKREKLDAESVRFFLEGSADYLASRRYASPENRNANLRLAAAVWQLHDLDFELMLDAEDLAGRFDDSMVYVLGERWTAALVSHCGDDAILRVLRALGRPEAPEDLSGLALWQDTLRAAGCSLEATLATWHQQMDDLVESHREQNENLPRLTGGPTREADGIIYLDLDLDRPDPGAGNEYLVRLRRDANAGPTEILVLSQDFAAADDPNDADASNARRLTFEASRRFLGAGPFEYQLGQRLPDSDWALFEEWQYAATVEAPVVD